MSPRPTLIVGIGSPHGDDQVGWQVGCQVAERLANDSDHDDIVVRQAKSPAEILDWLEGIERLIACDACRGLGRVGQLRRWVWPDRELADAAWSGTHDLSLHAALQLADRLGLLPQAVVIWSVEGAIGEAMAEMTPEVAAALPRLIDEIVSEVKHGAQCTNDPS